jgi:oxaloacetate decarboxylase (Na+ extruding) subunit alpha
MAQVRFIDTTIRDGSASLWAMEMRTSHMLPALPHLDRAGFDQMEFFAPGSRLKKFVRHLREDPWLWIKRGVEVARETPLRWHGGVASSRMSGHFSPAVADLLIEKAVSLGIRHTRAGSNWNDPEVTAEEKQRLERLGMTPVIDVIYSVSPRHTEEYFIERTRAVAALKPFRLCLKDVGGLLTPERARSLLPKLIAVSRPIEWEFHGHCNNSLGPLNAIEAAKAGVQYIHTAVPPLANGDSQPSIFNVAVNLRELGFDAQIDLDALQPVSRHFHEVAEREGFPVGVPHEYDASIYKHQIPGGMISNFRYQLAQVGMQERLPEILEETARVRAEYGYPIMVTPLSQIVGSQAAINVIVGERYREITEASIHYALGHHGGREAIELMDPDVRDRILSTPRAKQLEGWAPPMPTLAELRERFGSDISDEDLILRTIVGDDAVEVVRHADESARAEMRLVDLVHQLCASSRVPHLSLEGKDFRMRLRREDSRAG